ncbi:hypothetical protein ACSBR2_019689 [Camellia fascicularis]|uniref:Uncharacterized protein n=1 Tax=Camellia sinensis TaxID=4442 RepID=A0A7J7HF61_CAMSI|nr:auxin-responsive protein SAUR67-like [Camellia sinensis]KAF5951563.1 hypothetical protein HYC85_009507 [Camellia sinensis]
MISSKKLIKMARKWQKVAAISQKRIIFPRTTRGVDDADNCNTSTVQKGHFAVYTADQRRFVIPLAYLDTGIFKELLKMAEEEYGLPSHGPITLPCDAVFMQYAVSLIRRHAAKDLEKILLMSIATGRCLSSSCLQQEQCNKKLAVCS